MFEEIKKIIAEQLNINEESIQMDSKIKEDLGADSLDVLQLLMAMEEEHGVTIPDEKLSEFVTVGDVVNYIESAK